MILFSVIIPVFNRAFVIQDTIQSVLQQSYRYFEVIVVDDGSTDDTLAVVSNITDERVKVIGKSNGERGAARNYGARIAKGDYLNFFDSDDFMYPNHLVTALEMIQRYETPEVFHVNFELCDSRKKVIRSARQFTGTVNEYLIVSNDLACNSVFVRRDIALDNPFNEDRVLASAEDWELWLRLAARYPFHYTNRITYAQIEHAGRSLNELAPDRIIHRDERLVNVLLADAPFRKKFKLYLPRFISDRYTFITLTLALTKNRRFDTLRYLWKAVRTDISVVARKRFWASLKHWF